MENNPKRRPAADRDETLVIADHEMNKGRVFSDLQNYLKPGGGDVDHFSVILENRFEDEGHGRIELGILRNPQNGLILRLMQRAAPELPAEEIWTQRDSSPIRLGNIALALCERRENVSGKIFGKVGRNPYDKDGNLQPRAKVWKKAFQKIAEDKNITERFWSRHPLDNPFPRIDTGSGAPKTQLRRLGPCSDWETAWMRIDPAGSAGKVRVSMLISGPDLNIPKSLLCQPVETTPAHAEEWAQKAQKLFPRHMKREAINAWFQREARSGGATIPRDPAAIAGHPGGRPQPAPFERTPRREANRPYSGMGD